MAVEHKALKRKESKTRTFSVGSDEESDNESSSAASTPVLPTSSPEHKVRAGILKQHPGLRLSAVNFSFSF